MRRLTLLLLVLSACSHDTSGLRQPGTSDADVDGAMTGDGGMDAARDATMDTGVADTGVRDTGVADTGVADSGADTSVADSAVADTGVADTGVADTGISDSGAPDAGFLCDDFTYESATPGVGTAGIFMESMALNVWRFQTSRRFRVEAVGFTAEALSGGSFQGGVFRLDGPGDDPDGIFFATSDVMVQASRSISASVVQDISIPFTDAPRLAPGWYAVGVRLLDTSAVRFYGITPGGPSPYRLFSSGGTSSTGARRIFVRGCLERL